MATQTNGFDGGLVPLRVNFKGPEPVRLVHRDDLYVVEVLSGQWISHLETTDKAKAMEAVESFYLEQHLIVAQQGEMSR